MNIFTPRTARRRETQREYMRADGWLFPSRRAALRATRLAEIREVARLVGKGIYFIFAAVLSISAIIYAMGGIN